MSEPSSLWPRLALCVCGLDTGVFRVHKVHSVQPRPPRRGASSVGKHDKSRGPLRRRAPRRVHGAVRRGAVRRFALTLRERGLRGLRDRRSNWRVRAGGWLGRGGAAAHQLAVESVVRLAPEAADPIGAAALAAAASSGRAPDGQAGMQAAGPGQGPSGLAYDPLHVHPQPCTRENLEKKNSLIFCF